MINTEIKTKICTGPCREELPATTDYFYARKDAKDGLRNDCKKCRKEASNSNGRRRGKELKMIVIAHYGGKCDCCGETIIEFLTIDHINNDGAQHRRNIRNKIGSYGRYNCGRRFYLWLKRNNFPPGFQVLCWNCNCGRHINGGVCPHKNKGTNNA